MCALPLFSVIVPVYMVEDRLAQSAASVFEQSFSDWELLLVDDGSRDSSGNICDELARGDRRVRALHKENGGLSDARNAGIKAALGDYLLFLDGDDELLPEALSRAAKRLESKSYDLLIGRLRALDAKSGRLCYEADFSPDESILNSSDKDAALSELALAHLSPSACRYAVRREFLLKNGLFFEKGLLNEDALWTPRLLAAAESLCYEPAPFYLYYLRENSIMTSRSFKRAADALFIAASNYRFSREQDSEALRKFSDTLSSLALCASLADWRYFEGGQRLEIKKWFEENNALVREMSRVVKPLSLAVELLGPLSGYLACMRGVKIKNQLVRP